ncbi:MAG: hypothetical protein HY290_06925 [Planctomycetia bacterium]|nr:hypothetical protein [Planctomycetia bacterium]
MTWPTPQDYNEAIQNPRFCFSDDELRAGTPALTPLGLPKPISGAFASVYQMNCASRRWAVRCFLREVSDQQSRYQAISAVLRQADLACTVGFEFLAQGIRIRGRWFPILKMEWIEGEPLNTYIERHLNNPAALRSLAGQWRETLTALRKHEIAHGDLQHGNVLVSKGQIRLIDYDGMYVPALKGYASHEEGHRNYQHPLRTGGDFGPHLDAFSGWVVLLSLAALGVDPRLWQRLNAGDECLLFRRDDFENPSRSAAFQAILAARTPELRSIARQLKSFLALPAAQVPALDAAPLTLPDSRQQSAPLPDWLAHNRQSGAAEVMPDLPALDEPDHDPDSPPTEPLLEQLTLNAAALEMWDQVDFTGERVAAATTVLVVSSLAIASMVGFVAAWLPFVAGSVLAVAVACIMVFGYRSHPYHVRRRAAALKQVAVGQRLAQAEGQLQQLHEDYRHATAEIRLRRQSYYALHATLRNSLARIDARHAASREQCEREIRELEDRELDALDEIAWQLRQAAATATQRINQSFLEEQSELDQTLHEMRLKFVADYLRQHKLADASLEGIGPILKSRLASAGIATALDVDLQRIRAVEGIGEARARDLDDWARLHRAQAETLAPKSLSPLVRGPILMKSLSLRDELNARKEATERNLALRRQKVSDTFAAQRAAVDQNSIRNDDRHDREYTEACSQYDRDRQRLAGEFHALWPAASAELEQFRASRRKLEMAVQSVRGDLLRNHRQQALLAALTFRRYLVRMFGLR